MDITPDLVAESDVVASLHTEVGSVLANAMRGFETDLPSVLLVGFNDATALDRPLSAHFVTTCLVERDIFGPSSLSTVTVSPSLGE